MKRVLSPTPPPPSPSSAQPSNLKVTIKSLHLISSWRWSLSSADDVCGICQSPYESTCPGIKFPGDECPVVWGKCRHAFHLQCVSTWLGGGKNTCPICRREWEFDDSEEKR
ncbi:hypothetical protein TrVE_jg3409 [Triparma verrucosa]|uniref:Anaphase-promoting complex subunit 11 n=2 Tax=Triparma TaxID=722752 RepID=A0A9W7EF35_9STRA|nr:hypothetical protein TrST_g8162 [Triparma strigata]GMI03065.1 hypothetical protein TrVE_jg3409 [Triparma verrucosa]|mmetsp:Transcript_11057/g.19999  ORF Transcript_11057/g.19999 Transcript_11057/m.19999 type:complete len:111 (-) Transcript_11057:45-377(-)